MIYQHLFKELNNSNVKYLVIGGLALNLYGVPRSTFDIDLIISLDPENIRSIWSSLNSLGWYPMVPIKLEEFIDEKNRSKWKTGKNMLVLSFVNQKKVFQVVDVLSENPIDFDDCYTRRNVIYSNTIPISVISINDLIKLKLLANRQQDLADINALKRLKKINNE